MLEIQLLFQVSSLPPLPLFLGCIQGAFPLIYPYFPVSQPPKHRVGCAMWQTGWGPQGGFWLS